MRHPNKNCTQRKPLTQFGLVFAKKRHGRSWNKWASWPRGGWRLMDWLTDLCSIQSGEARCLSTVPVDVAALHTHHHPRHRKQNQQLKRYEITNKTENDLLRRPRSYCRSNSGSLQTQAKLADCWTTAHLLAARNLLRVEHSHIQIRFEPSE